MAWIKIPKEHHPIFLDALPQDDRIVPKRMFGAIAAMVNGHMMGGLWAHTAMVRLGKSDYETAIAAGAVPFDPMGKGNRMADMVELPEAHFRDGKRLREWLRKALTFTASLPPKVKGAAPLKKAPAKKASLTKATGAAKKRPTKKAR